MRGIQLFSPQYLSYYRIKPNCVGPQKNCPIDTILLSTHNIGLKGQIRISEHAKRPLSGALSLSILLSLQPLALAIFRREAITTI